MQPVGWVGRREHCPIRDYTVYLILILYLLNLDRLDSRHTVGGCVYADVCACVYQECVTSGVVVKVALE